MVERFATVPIRGHARRPPWCSTSGLRLDALRCGALRGGPLQGTGSTHSVVVHFAGGPLPGTRLTPFVVERLAAVPFWAPAPRAPWFSDGSLPGKTRRPPWWSASRRFSSKGRLHALRGVAISGRPVPGRPSWSNASRRSLSGTGSKLPCWSVLRHSRPGDLLDDLRGGALRGGPHPATSWTPSVVKRFAAVPFRG